MVVLLYPATTPKMFLQSNLEFSSVQVGLQFFVDMI